MITAEQVMEQAILLGSGVEEGQKPLLLAFCQCSMADLPARLKPGLDPAECEGFSTACSMMALAALGETENVPESFTVGEISLQPGKRNAASECLRNQAEMMMAPWTAGRFSFQGV